MKSLVQLVAALYIDSDTATSVICNSLSTGQRHRSFEGEIYKVLTQRYFTLETGSLARWLALLLSETSASKKTEMPSEQVNASFFLTVFTCVERLLRAMRAHQ